MGNEKYRLAKLLIYVVLIIPCMMITSLFLDKLLLVNLPWLKMLTQAVVFSFLIKAWLKYILGEANFIHYLELEKPTVKKLGLGVLFGVLVALMVVVIDNLTGGIRIFNLRGLNFGVVLGAIFFLAEAYIEEMITRGYVLEQILEMNNKAAALFGSALVFVVVQFLWDNPYVPILGWSNLFILAFFLGLLYLLTHSKWLCIGFHVAWNMIFTCFFPAGKPHVGHFANYLHLESIVTTVILLILIGISLCRLKKQSSLKKKQLRF